jgi:3-isopropylmalate/(R)-2-methylmalate dehydratase small subunit
MSKFTTLTSRVVPLLVNDIDTDQIIPARFLKATDKAGLGKFLFADWRYGADGSLKPEFILNTAGVAGAQILLAGDNFGCGSSREHAPWALVDYGFRAILSTSFADIFRGNAIKNGLLPVTIDHASHEAIAAVVAGDPGLKISVDLESQNITVPGLGSVPFPIDGFARTCLLNGVDELGYLLSFEKEIAAFERRTTPA